MFAILVTEENLPKILAAHDLSNFEQVSIEMYISNRADWYFVSGYQPTELGWFREWTVLPEYLLKSNFEIDFDHASTDWDQIVRL